MAKAYMPDDVKWYVAELVVAITIEGVRDTIVNINTVLVRADSPEEAHRNALELGRLEVLKPFRNLGGQLIRYRFLGLRNLNVIHDPLEHGCEISWRETRKRTMTGAKALTTPKRQLSVFRARVALPGPSRIDADLERELRARFSEEELTGRKPPRHKRKSVTKGRRAQNR